jgi:hypothetical protein
MQSEEFEGCLEDPSAFARVHVAATHVKLRRIHMGTAHFFNAVKITLVVASVLATAIGGVTASGLFEILARAFHARKSSSEYARTGQTGEGPIIESDDSGLFKALEGAWRSGHYRFTMARNQVYTRITEARLAKLKQERRARWSRWSANSLTFGQYIIGIVMGTAFVQKTLSPNIIGIFGVLVVVSSALKQHYHPEATAQIAVQRAYDLESLIRQSEDRLVVIETTVDRDADDPALVLELLERISAEISRITPPSSELVSQRSAPRSRR